MQTGMWVVKKGEEMYKKPKDHLNPEERCHLIILMAMEQNAKKFLNRKCLSKKDIYNLTKTIEWCEKFNKDLLERVGDAVSRKIVNTLKINEVRVISKYAPDKPIISEAATEDLEPAISELHLFHCNGCTKCDYKNCAVYAISVACDIDEPNKGDGCPFKLASLNLDELEDEDEF